MVERLIQRFLSLFPEKIIGGGCIEKRGPLMTRWIIFNRKRFSIVVHRFHRSDYDRALHDHPWNFITFLVGGGYFEHTPQGKFWRRRFSILYRPARWQHWVEIQKPIYTVVIKTRAMREWGFITKDGWVKWSDMKYEENC